MSPIKKPTFSFLLVPLVLAAPGCALPEPSVTDDTSDGTGREDTDTTSGPSLATTDDTGTSDTGTSDSGTSDSGTSDSGTSDSGTSDSGTSDSGTSDSGSSDSGSSDTGIEPTCGNGIIDVGEECDGIDLAGATCQSLGYIDGMLSCDDECSYERSGCDAGLSLSFSRIKQFDFSWDPVAGADYYQLEESAASGEPFVQIGGDIVGESISLTMPLHFRFDASYRLLACNAGGCTASGVVEVASSLAEAVGYVKASNTASYAFFGAEVALSGDGNTLAVGAIQEASDATGIDGDQADDSRSDAGAVYVLVRDGAGVWSQRAYVKASKTGSNDEFGSSGALSDGSTLAVGAPREFSNATGINGNQANNSSEAAGAVYLY